MCVIMVVGKVRPTQEMIERAWQDNPHGFGIAWREGEGENKEVVYEKGVMELERAKQLCAETPTPYVAHFRVASCGGVRPSLTHPFLVGPGANLDLQGRTKKAVLFHNGHWGAWNDKIIDAAIHSNHKIPRGHDWSDTRAMAWMTYLYGPGFLEHQTTQKGVLMTPEEFNVFCGHGSWDKINDVWCSNDYFWKGRNIHQNTGGNLGRRFCSVGRCNNRVDIGKDVCEECAKKAKERKEQKQLVESTVNKASSAVSIVTGGQQGHPFLRAFTLQQVEAFQKKGLISKSLLKKYRRANSGTHSGKESQRKRAEKEMENLSEDIAERFLTLEAGLTH